MSNLIADHVFQAVARRKNLTQNNIFEAKVNEKGGREEERNLGGHLCHHL
jgi:hypothetical protein